MLKKCITKCIYFLELLGILTIHGCSKDQIEVPNKVILIFQRGDGAIYLGQNLGIKVKYIDDYFIPHEFRPGEFKQIKYVIPTSREQIDIECYYKSAMAKHFLFKNGDSVRIRLEEKWPIVEILNRKVNKYESNFEKNKQQDLYQDKSSALEDYYYYWNHANNPISPVSGNIISEELYSLKERALRQLQQETEYIDSFLRVGEIRSEIIDYYNLKNQLEKDKLNLFNDSMINYSNTALIESIVSKINHASTDSALVISLYTYYDEFITQYYLEFLSNKLENIAEFDSIVELEDNSTVFNRSLLLKHIDHIINSSSVEQGRKLLESFDNDTLSEYWSDYFYSKYNLDQNIDLSWSILDNQNNFLSFQKLIQEKQGYLLYVDFWASWCLPSIKEMAAFEDLHKTYQSNPIEIVHISVDIDFKKWRWAENEYLGFNQNNSFILDSLIERESFIIDSVPRFMLFDQKGKLIHRNAPWPDTKEIRNLLNKYFEEI